MQSINNSNHFLKELTQLITSTPDNRLSIRGPVSAETKSEDRGEGMAVGEVSLFNIARTKKSNRNRVSIIFTVDVKS